MVWMVNRRLGAAVMAMVTGLLLVCGAVPSAQARPGLNSSFDFGALQAGGGRYIGVQVSASDEPTTIEGVELSNPDSPFWIEGEDCVGNAMDVNEVCYIGLVFQAPDVDGGFQDTLIVTAEDGEVATSLVQGTAYRAGGLTAEPAQVDWVGSFSTRHVVLRNRTAEPLWVDSVAITSGFSVTGTNRCLEEIYPGDTCSISLRASAAPGDTNGFLTVRHAEAYMISPGSFSPIPPFSTLSVPLTRTARTRLVRPPFSLPKPVAPDYGPIEIDLANLTDSIPRLIRGGPARSRLLPRFKAPTAGRLSLALFGWQRGQRVRLGGGTLKFDGAHSRRLRFQLNGKGVALLRRSQRSHVKVVLRFTPRGDSAIQQAPVVVVKPPKPKRR